MTFGADWTLFAYLGIVAFVGLIGIVRARTQPPPPPPVIDRPITQPSTVSRSNTRACPFCAEDIKLEAKLCRFCGQAVPAFEAPPPPRPDELSDDDRSALADEFGATFDEALVLMDGLDGRPANPAAWLRELCSRMRAGSTPELAAQRIPLSWPNG